MTREIPLSQGLVALVDDADFDLVTTQGKWFAHKSRRTFYAVRKQRANARRFGSPQMLSMHTLLTGWSIVDHRDGDGLNNTRANLREASPFWNSANRRLRLDSTSGFKGVSRTRYGKWTAAIYVRGQKLYLGNHETAEAAARAYDRAAVDAWGDFASPNFPRETADR